MRHILSGALLNVSCALLSAGFYLVGGIVEVLSWFQSDRPSPSLLDNPHWVASADERDFTEAMFSRRSKKKAKTKPQKRSDKEIADLAASIIKAAREKK